MPVRKRGENMAIVKVKYDKNEKLSKEQIKQLEEAEKYPITYDEDSPYYTLKELREMPSWKSDEFFKYMDEQEKLSKANSKKDLKKEKKNKEEENNSVVISESVIDFYKKLAGKNYKKKINEDLEKLIQLKL